MIQKLYLVLVLVLMSAIAVSAQVSEREEVFAQLLQERLETALEHMELVSQRLNDSQIVQPYMERIRTLHSQIEPGVTEHEQLISTRDQATQTVQMFREAVHEQLQEERREQIRAELATRKEQAHERIRQRLREYNERVLERLPLREEAQTQREQVAQTLREALTNREQLRRTLAQQQHLIDKELLQERRELIQERIAYMQEQANETGRELSTYIRELQSATREQLQEKREQIMPEREDEDDELANEQVRRCPAAGACVEFVGADSCPEAGLPSTHGVANQYVCLTNGQVDNTQVCCVPMSERDSEAPEENKRDLSTCESRGGACVRQNTCDGTVSSASCPEDTQECCLSGSTIKDRIGDSGNFQEGVSNCNTVCTNSVQECRSEGYESGVPMTCSIDEDARGSYCCVLPTG
ncbi:MAG: hypothetical protein ACMXYF_05595 [Candidatus Woesearchaeota archaeon]